MASGDRTIPTIMTDCLQVPPPALPTVTHGLSSVLYYYRCCYAATGLSAVTVLKESDLIH